MESLVKAGAFAAYAALLLGAVCFSSRVRRDTGHRLFALRTFGVLGFGVLLLVLGVHEARISNSSPNALSPFGVGVIGMALIILVALHNVLRIGLRQGAVGTALQLALAPFAVVLAIIAVVGAMAVLLGFKGFGLLLGEAP